MLSELLLSRGARVSGVLIAAALIAQLGACSGCDDGAGDSIPPATFVVTNPGVGPTNIEPLEPLVVGERSGDVVVSARLANGHYEMVRLPSAVPVIDRTPRGGGETARAYYRRGPHGIESLGGGGGLGDYGRQAPIVIVPDTVRFGMTWQSGTTLAGEPYTLTVSARSEMPTPLGTRVVWTISWGPPVATRSMTFIEGLGFVELQSDGAFALSAYPASDAAQPTAPEASDTTNVALPAGVELDPSNFSLTRATALEREDGTLELALVGAAVGFDGFSLPQAVLEHHCLELTADGVVTAATSLLGWTVQQRFPWDTATEPCRLGDLSMVTRNQAGDLMTMASRGGRDTLIPFSDNSGFYHYGAVWVKDGDGDPSVLRLDRLNFGWQRPQDGAGGNGGTPWNFGPGTTAAFGLLNMYQHDETGVLPRRDGRWFVGQLPDLNVSSDQFAYQLTPEGMLARVRIRPSNHLEAEPLFPILDAITIMSNTDGEQRVLATSLDGTVRRLVLEPGAERLETLGRVELGARDQLAGAVQLRSGDVLVLVNNNSAEQQTSGPTSVGQVPYWRPQFSIRKARLTGTTATPAPPALGVDAKLVGTDAVVCWPPTSTPLDPAGWTLGGTPAVVVPLGGMPCALAIRDASTTTEQLGAIGANAIVATIPDVGVMRLSARPSMIPAPSSPGAMVGDFALLDARNIYHVGGVPSIVMLEPDGFGISLVADDVMGAWHRSDQGALTHHNPDGVPVTTNLPSYLVYDLAGYALGGGAVVSARVLEAFAFSGNTYLVRPDGTTTYLAATTPTNRVWLPDGRSCVAATTLDCYAPDAGAPTVSIAIGGGSFVGATLRTFSDGSVMAVASGKAYRLDITAGTATAIDAAFSGLLTGLTRRADGSLWAVVQPGPTEVAPPPGRIARIRPDGIDVYTFVVPAYVPAGGVPSALHPGSTIFAVTVNGMTVRIPAPVP